MEIGCCCEVYQSKKAKPQLEAPPATKQASTHYRWKPTLKKQKAILGELVQTNVAAGPVYDSELANAHIAAGKLVLLGPPLPNPPWWNKYMQLLNAKGIERIVVSRPGVGLTQADHQYNTVMQTEIQRRFGAGILSKLLSEAKGQ